MLFLVVWIFILSMPLILADEILRVPLNDADKLAFSNGAPGRCLSMATLQKAVLSDVIHFEPLGPRMSKEKVKQMLVWSFCDELPVTITGFESILDLSKNYGDVLTSFLNEYNFVENIIQVKPHLICKILHLIPTDSNEQIVQKIDAELRQGNPVIIGLDVTYGDNNSENHAVLITGKQQEGDVIYYEVYDPNFLKMTMSMRYKDGVFHYLQRDALEVEEFKDLETSVILYRGGIGKFKKAQRYKDVLNHAISQTEDHQIKGVGQLRNRGFFSGGLLKNYIEVEGVDLYPLQSQQYDLSKYKDTRVAFRGSLIWTGPDQIKEERDQPVYNVDVLYRVSEDENGNITYSVIPADKLPRQESER